MKRRLLPLLALLLSACPHGALKTDSPSSGPAKHDTPLLDVIPKQATMAIVLRAGAVGFLNDLYKAYPGLREKTSAFYVERFGVDLNAAKSFSIFTVGEDIGDYCSFYPISAPDQPKGAEAGKYRGVTLTRYEKQGGPRRGRVMAAVRGGLLMGSMGCVKAAIDRVKGDAPPPSLRNILGELRFADRDGAEVLFSIAPEVLKKNPLLSSVALEGIALVYDAERRLILRIKAPAEQLSLLERMLNGLLALQLQKLGERKNKALASASMDVAATHLMLHHIAMHYGKELAPVVEKGRLVSRLKLPAKELMLGAILMTTLTIVALPVMEEEERKARAKASSPAPNAAAAETPGTTGSATIPQGPKVPLELYIMSKCPYGVQAMAGISGLMKKLGPRVGLSMDYIVTRKKDGSFEALHGPEEVKGNIVQLCARDLYPKQRRWLPFIDCVNASWRKIPDGWEQCAQKAQLDVARLRGCVDGSKGGRLLAASAARAKSARATGSPTIVIGGEPYRGDRETDAFLRVVCRKMNAPLPAACSALPKPVKVTVTILTDKRCKDCTTQGLESNLRGRFFPSLVVETLDYNTKAGKRLYRTLRKEHKHLPIWLFGAEVAKTEKFGSIKRWLKKQRDGRYVLRIPSSFDPTAEICDNGIDDTRNGRVDCKDATCKKKLLCRKEKKRQLQVFVMSQCPFAAKGLLALQEVKQLFGKRLRFDIHYIVSKPKDGKTCRGGKVSNSGFCALHGESEVEENIRQLCAKKHYKRDDKYLDYVWCRMKEFRSNDWRPCARDGIRASVIDRCATGSQGRRLLARDMKEAEALKIHGSPSWLANNRFKFSGVTAESIKKSFCKHNPKTPGCEKTLSNKAGVKGSCGQ